MSISVVSANDVGPAVFLPNNFQPGNDTEPEIELASDTCTYIVGMLANEYGLCYFCFDDYCTVYNYGWLLYCIRDDYDQQVVFSKGHRGVPYCDLPPPYNNTDHFSLLAHNGDDIIDDYIYDVTSSENAVTFIWHCQTAQHYTYGSIPYDYYGYYGMPYCWSHNEYMYPWGVSGNQVFLGWVGQSPQFETQANGAYNHAHVAYLFWNYMCNGAIVRDALDDLCDDIWGTTFLQSPLSDATPTGYNLTVYGNRDLPLPVEW